MDRAGTWAEQHGLGPRHDAPMGLSSQCLFRLRAEGLGGKGLETGKDTVYGMDNPLLRASQIRSYKRRLFYGGEPLPLEAKLNTDRPVSPESRFTGRGATKTGKAQP